VQQAPASARQKPSRLSSCAAASKYVGNVENFIDFILLYRLLTSTQAGMTPGSS
jgi:hypothetical protein